MKSKLIKLPYYFIDLKFILHEEPKKLAQAGYNKGLGTIVIELSEDLNNIGILCHEIYHAVNMIHRHINRDKKFDTKQDEPYAYLYEFIIEKAVLFFNPSLKVKWAREI
jgi:hypothetical protein